MPWFAELHAARGASGFGANPLSHADVLAWCTLTRRRPLAHELQWIFALDRAFLAVQAEEKT